MNTSQEKDKGGRPRTFEEPVNFHFQIEREVYRAFCERAERLKVSRAELARSILNAWLTTTTA